MLLYVVAVLSSTDLEWYVVASSQSFDNEPRVLCRDLNERESWQNRVIKTPGGVDLGGIY
jgi:hypothetical protein